MFLRTTCPSCGELHELAQQQRGHKVRCPQCNLVFAPEIEEVAEEGEKPAGSSSPRRKRRKGDERPRPLRRRAGPRKWILLAVVGLCVLAVLIAATALLVYTLQSK